MFCFLAGAIFYAAEKQKETKVGADKTGSHAQPEQNRNPVL